MPDDINVQVDDLVLFFDNPTGNVSEVTNRLVPYVLYTNPELKADSAQLPNGWDGCIFMEAKAADGSTYYVANLSRLVAPLVVPDAASLNPRDRALPPVQPGTGKIPPSAGDLFIVPYDDAASCYRVPQTLYQACEQLGPTDVADMDFMAVHEGVVLANIPKMALTGFTCYLLNLLSLRSAQLTNGKTENARAVAARVRHGRST